MLFVYLVLLRKFGSSVFLNQCERNINLAAHWSQKRGTKEEKINASADKWSFKCFHLLYFNFSLSQSPLTIDQSQKNHLKSPDETGWRCEKKSC